MTAQFRRAVAEVAEGEWQPLEREVDGQRVKTGQEWAEVCFVPNWTAPRKDGPTYRYIAIRELLEQAELPGLEVQLPFPRIDFGQRQYKVFGLVTNRVIPGDKLIWWHRGRCGKGEEIHKIMKEDLAWWSSAFCSLWRERRLVGHDGPLLQPEFAHEASGTTRGVVS